MGWRARSAAALALLVWGGLALPSIASEPTVIVLSWDGLRHDYALDRAPGLARMSREGARAERLVPPFPSNTFPGHVTLATGTHPDRHGIVGNRFIDPERGLFDYANDASWIEAEPLWAAAERQGVRAAVFFWVGSESDWRGVGATHRMAPFDGQVGEAEKVDRILAWLSLPTAERPGLVMAWWHGADHAGHRSGPASEAVGDALAEQDAELRRLLDGLAPHWSTTTLIVVGDHGMAAAGDTLDATGALRDAGVDANVVAGGGMAHVYLAPGADAMRAASALRTLGDVRVHARDELPERLRLRHRRTGDLVAITRPPRLFSARGASGFRLRVLGWLGLGPGMHGYDPEDPRMGSMLVAFGRGVPARSDLGVVHAVDLAPSVAALLGIEPPAQSEGRALFGGGAPP